MAPLSAHSIRASFQCQLLHCIFIRTPFYPLALQLHSITNEPIWIILDRLGKWKRAVSGGMKRIVNLSLLPLCFYKWKKVECVKNTKEKNKSTNSTPSFPFLLVQFNYNEVREEKEAWIKLNKKRKKGNEVVSLFFVLCSIIEVERERALHYITLTSLSIQLEQRTKRKGN